MYYSGETDEQVFGPRANGFERLLSRELDIAERACVERLFEALDVMIQTEQQFVPETHDSRPRQEWFHPAHEAAPIVGTVFAHEPENPALTMSQGVIDHQIDRIERRTDGVDTDAFDLSGLDDAMSAEQTRQYFEGLQNA